MGELTSQLFYWKLRITYTAKKLVLSENLVQTNMTFEILLTLLHDIQPHVYGIIKRQLHVKQFRLYVKMSSIKTSCCKVFFYKLYIFKLFFKENIIFTLHNILTLNNSFHPAGSIFVKLQFQKPLRRDVAESQRLLLNLVLRICSFILFYLKKKQVESQSIFPVLFISFTIKEASFNNLFKHLMMQSLIIQTHCKTSVFFRNKR